MAMLEEVYKPGLQQMLKALKLDIQYHRGSGSRLFYLDAAGDEVEVLDCVGGYGSLLFGHAHPKLVAAANCFWTEQRVNLVQGALRPESLGLARELSKRAGGDFCCVFSSSGTEAVEVAMKHAMLETGGRSFLVLERGFHGKTLGALQLTSNRRYREPFLLSGLDVRRVAPDCVRDLERAFQNAESLAGMICEPIQGEAGVRPLDAGFIQRAAALCRERGVPFIVDECQTGMGRTGRFLASHWLGVVPDYIVLSKSLGGGVAKIAATLIDRRRYRAIFDLMHTSTFADDGYSSAMASATLELVDSSLMDHCRDIGGLMKAELSKLVARYPRTLREVRGQGLLLGVEFRDRPDAESFSLRYWSAEGLVGPLVSAHQLRRHRIRVAPTLSDPFTIRLQPSAQITREDVGRIVESLADVCGKLECEDVVGVAGFLADGEPADFTIPRWHASPPIAITHASPRGIHSSVRPGLKRVAWLFHLVGHQDMVHLDGQLAELPRASRPAFVDRLASIAEPVLMEDVEVSSPSGCSVCVTPILLPVSSHWMRRMFEQRELQVVRQLVQRGVSLAESIGCEIASLGQFTSIVTRNGRSLAAGKMRLVTGNSYTTALAVESVLEALRRDGRPASDCTLAIVGAGGNIGAACVELLAGRFAETILLGSGRTSTSERLKSIARVRGAMVAGSRHDVSRADVVLCATNSLEVAIPCETLGVGAVVCDVSVPSAFASTAQLERPDVEWIAGGTVRLPMGETISIPGFPLPSGCTYGCMAEAILLGCEPDLGESLTGPVRLGWVRHLQTLAQKHGFSHAVMDSHPQSLAKDH